MVVRAIRNQGHIASYQTLALYGHRGSFDQPAGVWPVWLVWSRYGQNIQTFIYPIWCLDLTLSELRFIATLFFQTSPWDSLRVGFVGRWTCVSRGICMDAQNVHGRTEICMDAPLNLHGRTTEFAWTHGICMDAPMNLCVEASRWRVWYHGAYPIQFLKNDTLAGWKRV